MNSAPRDNRRLPVSARLCAWGALLVAFLIVTHRAQAASSGWIQTTVTGHGVRLTLSIRRLTYPQDALVRVWAHAENLTAHTVHMYDDGPQAAGKYIPQVVVLARPHGEPLPISLNDYMPFPGPGPFAYPLYPHRTINIPELAVVRGPLVRLDLTFAGNQSQKYQPGIGPTLSTPLLRLKLTASDSPKVSLHIPPAQASADIAPSGQVRGPLWAVWFYNCGDAYDSAIQENIDWTTIGRHIIPTCPSGSSLTGWHEFAGWLNHSVAQIDWSEPAG